MAPLERLGQVHAAVSLAFEEAVYFSIEHLEAHFAPSKPPSDLDKFKKIIEDMKKELDSLEAALAKAFGEGPGVRKCRIDWIEASKSFIEQRLMARDELEAGEWSLAEYERRIAEIRSREKLAGDRYMRCLSAPGQKRPV